MKCSVLYFEGRRFSNLDADSTLQYLNKEICCQPSCLCLPQLFLESLSS